MREREFEVTESWPHQALEGFAVGEGGAGQRALFLHQVPHALASSLSKSVTTRTQPVFNSATLPSLLETLSLRNSATTCSKRRVPHAEKFMSH